jgi:hypothetical protein
VLKIGLCGKSWISSEQSENSSFGDALLAIPQNTQFPQKAKILSLILARQ